MSRKIKTYHIISKYDWNKEKDNPLFGRHEIEQFGFIHTSKIKGLQKIMKRYMGKEKDYLILTIDIDEDLAIYEDKDKDYFYPHFYELIDKDYITDVIELSKFY